MQPTSAAPVQGVRAGKSIMSMATSSTGNTNAFYAIGVGSDTVVSTTEANVDLDIQFPMLVTRVQAVVLTNGKDGATTLSFRDDGADIGALTVNAAATGEFDSGALATVVAAGSQINFRRDASASTTGSLVFTLYITYYALGN